MFKGCQGIVPQRNYSSSPLVACCQYLRFLQKKSTPLTLHKFGYYYDGRIFFDGRVFVAYVPFAILDHGRTMFWKFLVSELSGIEGYDFKIGVSTSWVI